MKQNITSKNLYEDNSIYENLSDKELKDIYDDLKTSYWVDRMKEEY